MATTASLETFFEQIRSGKLMNDKQIVYNAIQKSSGITLMDLKRRLKMQHQTVSARVTDLLDMGVVEVIGTQKRIGAISITQDSMFVVQENTDIIIHNKKIRLEKKFQRALKNVLSYDYHLTDELKLELNKLVTNNK